MVSKSPSLTHVSTPSWATSAGSPHWCFEAWLKDDPTRKYWTNALGRAHALWVMREFHNKCYSVKTSVKDWEIEKMPSIRRIPKK